MTSGTPDRPVPPRGRRTSPLSAIALMLPMLAVLIGLGVWQLERRAWKQELLERLDTAETMSPVDVGGATPSSLAEFTPVMARGRVVPGGMRVVPRTLDGRVGAAIVGWVALENGRILAVDRGWAPDGVRADAFGDQVEVRGWVRFPPEQQMFQPDNDPAGGNWFRFEPRAMARAAGLDADAVLPFYLQASAIDPPAERYPIPASEPPRPPDNHLQYAITWFTLAGALLVVFLIWLRRRNEPPRVTVE